MLIESYKNKEETLKDHPCKYSWNGGAKGIVKVITNLDFWSIFESYSPKVVAHSQITEDLEKFKDNRDPQMQQTMISASLFYYGDYVLMVEHDYWNKRVNFWKIMVCDHDWKELSVKEAQDKGQNHFGMCYHVYECKACGKFTSQDSSG